MTRKHCIQEKYSSFQIDQMYIVTGLINEQLRIVLATIRGETRYRPGGGETICPLPLMAV